MAEALQVEVVWATAERQEVARLEMPPGSTVAQAIAASGLLDRHPEIDLATNRVGVFGALTNLDSPLRSDDRIEIYRPLRVDPRESRRRRAAAARPA